MDAVSQASEYHVTAGKAIVGLVDCSDWFINLACHPLEETPSHPLGEPFVVFSFTAEYDPSELVYSREQAEAEAIDHNTPLCDQDGVGQWLQTAQITSEVEGPVQATIRPDGKGGGVIELTRRYRFRITAECSSDEAQAVNS